MKKILLITNRSGKSEQVENLRSFVNGINTTSNQKFEFCMVQDLIFSCKDSSISITLQGQELHQIYGVIHLRNQGGYADFANALRLYCEHYGLSMINEMDATMPYFGKVSQGFLFALNDVPTPPLTSSPSNQTLCNYLDGRQDYPIIIKHNDGIMGLDNYLVKNATEMRAILSGALQGFVAQPFIKNTGELRVLTFGKQVSPFIFRKYSTTDSHLNNTSRGGGAEEVDVNSVDKVCLEHAIRAAELTNREVGGVDVLLAEDGKHYILEVNYTPAIASGVFADKKAARYGEYIKHKLTLAIKKEDK